jgi:hypothetical protein
MARSSRRRALRPVDVLLLVPSLALGLVLVAVHLANVTAAPVSSVLTPPGLARAVPAAVESSGGLVTNR